jgi:hypothetical protein
MLTYWVVTTSRALVCLQVLQKEQFELKQRLEGLDVDILLCDREEAAKKVEETEAIVAERRMHVSIAEEACKRVSAEQKLLSEKLEV